MVTITQEHLERLVQIESHIHYGELPPPEVLPFVVTERNSRVVLSAPHGARTFRNSAKQRWHEEDEYTAGMALLLSELCYTSVIATTWRMDNADPNDTQVCDYKNALRDLAQNQGIRFLIDLHGAAQDCAKVPHSWVDLGTGVGRSQSMTPAQLREFKFCIQRRLGNGTVSHNKWRAAGTGCVRTFSWNSLHVRAVQVEMKPCVRVPIRRTDASSFASRGPYSAAPDQVIGMMQALADFIDYLHHRR